MEVETMVLNDIDGCCDDGCCNNGCC